MSSVFIRSSYSGFCVPARARAPRYTQFLFATITAILCLVEPYTCTGTQYTTGYVGYNISWSSANTGIASIYSKSGPNVTVLGNSGGTTQITGYIENPNPPNCSGSGGGPGTVQVPSFLKLVSAPTDNMVCLGLGCEMDRTYRVVDGNGAPIQKSGMSIKESVSRTGGNCTVSINDAGSWTTDSTGTMTVPDTILFCCSTGSTCGITLNQTFTVNGAPVLLMPSGGLPTGTHNVITVSCTNGTGSCPTVQITQ